MSPSGSQPLATLKILSASGDRLATLFLAKTADGLWQSTVEPSDDVTITAIIHKLEPYVSDGEGYLTTLIGELQKASLQAQLESQVITAQIQIDARTGSIIGSSTAMFNTPGTETLGRKVFNIVHQTVQQLSSDEVEALESGLVADQGASGVLPTAPAFIGNYSEEQLQRLLQAYNGIDLQKVSSDQRFEILRRSLEVADQLRDYKTAKEISSRLVHEYSDRLSRADIVAARTIQGIYSAVSNRLESALLRFRELLNEDDLPATQRGWLWRNVSLSLKLDEDDALQAARLSADAFLQAGDKLEAGRSLMRLHRCYAVTRPTDAQAPLDELVELYDGADLASREQRAAALHARAQWLSSMSNHTDALRDAKEAVTLLRGLLGKESQLAASLFLSSFEAAALQLPEAQSIRTEAEDVAAQGNSKYFELTTKVSALLANYDHATSAALVPELTALRLFDLLAAVRIAQVFGDDNLSATDKIELLEECLGSRDYVLSDDMRLEVRKALADLLLNSGAPERALPIYESIATEAPVDGHAFWSLINALWGSQLWGEAASALAARMRLLGENLTSLFAYGKSLHNAGDSSTAIPVLARVKNEAQRESNLWKAADLFLDRALKTGATPRAVQVKEELTRPVTLAEVDDALEAFKRFVSGDARMRFWENDKWVTKPEALAELLLQGFLKARFDERALPLTQIRSGAGFIDIFAQFMGGLAICIELKMCGGGYSSTYAAAGEDQLVHYMEHRSNYGYLVVLDGRLENNGAALLLGGVPHQYTIREVLVNVSPRVSKRTRGKRT